MNHSQTNTANMFARMMLFFTKYAVTLQTFPMLWGFVTSFQDGFAPLKQYTSLQDTESEGQTTDKQSAWLTLANAIVPLSRKAMVWAKSMGNGVLVKLFDVQVDDFRIPDTEVAGFAQNIIDGLNANILALAVANIVQKQVDAAQTTVDDFAELIGTPQQAIKLAKVGTESLVKTLNDENDLLHSIDNLLIPEYAADNIDMVNEYKNNRKVGDVHHIHTMVTAHVYSDAAHTVPVPNATISIPSLGLSVVGDLLGTGALEKFKGGELEMLVQATGFKDQTQVFTIKTGQQMDLLFVMSA